MRGDIRKYRALCPFEALKNINLAWYERESNHLKKPWQVDGNAEQNDGKEEKKKTFCLLGLVAQSCLSAAVDERVAHCREPEMFARF